MPSDLLYLPALELRDLIAAKKISPVEAVEHALARMEQVEPALNCSVTPTRDAALAAAKRAEQTVLQGGELGLLHGLPVSIKDLIAVERVKFTFGSKTMADNVAALDAPAVERVKAHGACIIGKTTTSEFGCKAVGDSPLTGITRNPWNLEKTPGGSSCGAAASIAAGVTPFGLGTDGGGSIRIPGSLTGLFGIKAHFARVPVFPASATPTLAHVGPLARTVRDAALLLGAIAGFDERDPFSIAGPVPNFLKACGQPVKGMRIAWSPSLGYARPDHEVRAACEAAVKTFEDLGCHVDTVDEVMDEDPIGMWMAEFFTGVGTRLRQTLDEQPGLLDPAVVPTLNSARNQPIDDYYAQVFKRYEFREKMRRFMADYDLLITPTLPVPAFDVGQNMPEQMPDANIISWVAYTYPFNLTGHPAATLPAGFTEQGLPVGLQLVSKALCETDIFRAAAAFEEARPWARDKPPVG